MKVRISATLPILVVIAFIFGAWLRPIQSAPALEKPVNLIKNGSFEEGVETDRFISLNEGATDIKGWTVTRGQIDLVGAYWKAADGKYSLDLNGSPGFGGVKQTIATKKGVKYRVSFSFAGNPEGSVPMKKMAVEAAGSSKEFAFDTTGKSKDDIGWETKTWDFTAEGDKTVLEFRTTMTEDGNCGPLLDNVSVFAAD